MNRSDALTVHPLRAIPEVRAGDDLGVILRDALLAADLELRDGDVLAVSSKIISKAWGLRLDDTGESAGNGDASAPAANGDASAPAANGDTSAPARNDVRQEAVLAHSTAVVAERRTPAGTTRIVRAVAGPVMTGAGIDGSNTGEDPRLLTLPEDPDEAARQVHAQVASAYAPAALPQVGLVVTDTAGRPWRQGQTDFALGACGLTVLEDLRGTTDADGRDLSVTARAVADEIAAAADLVKGKATGIPAAVLRGLPAGTVADPAAAGASTLVRTGPGDWFALGSAEAVRSALGVPPGTAAAQEIGIASTAPEDEPTRLSRAIRLAQHGQPPVSVTVSTGPTVSTATTASGEVPRLEVTAADAFTAGRACARLEVALASEGLSHIEVVWSEQEAPVD